MLDTKIAKGILECFRAKSYNRDVEFLTACVVVAIDTGRHPVNLDNAYTTYLRLAERKYSIFSKQKFRELLSYLAPDAMLETRKAILKDGTDEVVFLAVNTSPLGWACRYLNDLAKGEVQEAVDAVAE